MFLLVMLVILVWRVYKVMNPEKVEDPPVAAPSTSVGAAFPATAKPGVPPEPGELPPPWDFSSLWTRNPFTVYSDTNKTSGTNNDKADDIELLDIQKKGGAAPTVKLRYGNTQKWHKEGDSFVSYKLLSINVEEKTCEVYSERRGRSIILKKK